MSNFSDNINVKNSFMCGTVGTLSFFTNYPAYNTIIIGAKTWN